MSSAASQKSRQNRLLVKLSPRLLEVNGEQNFRSVSERGEQGWTLNGDFEVWFKSGLLCEGLVRIG